MRTRALVLSLFLAGCSSSVTPAIEIRTIPLPAAEDAGASAAEGTDGSEPPDSGPGDVSNADAAAPAEDAAPAVDAAPAIVCTVAGASYGKLCNADLSRTTLYLCTDGDAGAACPSADQLIAFSTTDGTSFCCGR